MQPSRVLILILSFLVMLLSVSGASQAAACDQNQLLVPGVAVGQVCRPGEHGPITIRYLQVDLAYPGVDVRPVLAQGVIPGRESVTSMTQRSGALAGINAHYFSWTGRLLGLMIMNGRLISDPIYQRSGVALTGDGRLVVGRFGVSKRLRLGRWAVPVDGVDRERGDGEIVVFTPEYGSRTRTQDGEEFVLTHGYLSGRGWGNSRIPPDGMVISAGPKAHPWLTLLAGAYADHREAAFEWRLRVDAGGDAVEEALQSGVQWAVGGGPRLVKDGSIFITSQAERFLPDVAYGRAPRTALGIDGNGSLFLVAVGGGEDGARDGLTLLELAQFMIDLGAVDAVNLDGGSSTTFVVRKGDIRFPTVQKERMVGSGLLVFSNQTLGEE